MTYAIQRRLAITGLLALATGLAASTTRATPPALPDGVRLLRGDYAPPRQPDGNSLLFATGAGWIAFDSGRHPAHAQALLALAGDEPIALLVNSHWHLDHVGGNPALRAAHPRLQVLATPAIDAALKGFLADYAVQLRTVLDRQPDAAGAGDWRAELARIEAGAALRPDRRVVADEEFEFGGRRFLLAFAAGATDGDLWLLDRGRRVLAAGDLVTLPAPFFDTACPRRWQDALTRLAAQDFDVLVPGHGAPMTAAGLRTWQTGFDRLLACAATPAADADCVRGWLEDVAPLLPDEAARQQATGLLEYYLPQVLRAPATARRCAGAA